VELTDTVLRVFGYSLDIFGIFPRKFYGLLGILFAPLLHGGWFHLMSNTVAFLGLGFAMMLAEKERFLVTTFLLVFWSGLGTWLIGGSGTVHIGASGMIYGYFGYLLARAWTERRALWIVGGIVVAILYGSMLWGVVPSHRGISWEAHLCGLIAGIVLGRQHGLTSAGRGPR
jgi:membrane associated rhomboid family serine protease